MQLEIKEIDGEVYIRGNVITITNGKITLTDGTVIRSGQDYSDNQTSKDSSIAQPKLTEEFNFESFNTITTHSYFDVEFFTGEKTEVIVEAPQHIIESIVVDCKGHNLDFDVKPGIDINTCSIKAKVTAPRVTQFISFGGSKINITNHIKSDGTIMIATHDGSKIIANNITSPNVYVTASEASSINIVNIDAQTAIISKSVQASHITVGNKTNTQNLYITASEASSTSFSSITAQHVIVKSSGGSNNKLAGNAENIDFTAAQRSLIDAQLLAAENGKATAKDIAHIEVNVKGKLEKHAALLAKVRNS